MRLRVRQSPNGRRMWRLQRNVKHIGVAVYVSLSLRYVCIRLIRANVAERRMISENTATVLMVAFHVGVGGTSRDRITTNDKVG